jgi:DNA-binding MarR family transcriptional regulator
MALDFTTYWHDINAVMKKQPGVHIAVGIAEALRVGSTLMVRHLARGTSLTSRNVLAALAGEGPSRLTTLATATGIAQPAMTQLVGRMEREGLVVRLIDPEDARATLVAITDTGRALRDQLHQSAHERTAELLERLSADDQATLALAMRVAMPLLQQLTRDAAEHPQSEPTAASSIA